MTTVSSATSHFILLHAKLLSDSRLETSRIEGCQCSHLTWLQTRIKESYETSEVGRVENNNHMLHVWAVSLDVLTQILCNLTVASKKILGRKVMVK